MGNKPLAEEGVGDDLLLGEALARHRADIIAAMAVGVLDRRCVDVPQAREERRRLLRMALCPDTRLLQFGEDDLQLAAVACGKGNG